VNRLSGQSLSPPQGRSWSYSVSTGNPFGVELDLVARQFIKEQATL
jgi:hypothetical protein